MKTTTYRWAIAAERAARLAMIMDGYDVQDEPDGSIPGAARLTYTIADQSVVDTHPRYVLVTQYGDKGNYRVHLAEDRAGVESLAAYVTTDASGGEAVICFFDLDELAGPAPQPTAVTYKGVEWDVWSHNGDDLNIERSDGTRDTVSIDSVTVIEWDREDERMPVRYGVAKVIVSVVFNTAPSP